MTTQTHERRADHKAITEPLRLKIRAVLSASGLSDTAIARAARVPQPNVSEALRGVTDPRVTTIDALLGAVGYRLTAGGRPLAELLDGAGPLLLSVAVRLTGALGHPLRVERIDESS